MFNYEVNDQMFKLLQTRLFGLVNVIFARDKKKTVMVRGKRK